MPSAKSNPARHAFHRASWPALLLSLGFGAALQIARALISAGVVSSSGFAWLLAAVVVVLGVFALRAMARFIAAMDELWIRIYQRSLSFAFGVAMLGLLSYPLFRSAGAPSLSPEIYGALCIVLFVGALFFNARKFT